MNSSRRAVSELGLLKKRHGSSAVMGKANCSVRVSRKEELFALLADSVSSSITASSTGAKTTGSKSRPTCCTIVVASTPKTAAASDLHLPAIVLEYG